MKHDINSRHQTQTRPAEGSVNGMRVAPQDPIMFQHSSVDGERHRVVESNQSFVPEILESRDPQHGKTVEQVGRLQHTVIQGTLVQRFLPSVNTGPRWPHDTVGDPWWEVVSHPPHGGVVADFNKALGGAYPRVLDPKHQVVAFAEHGEEVLITNGVFSVTRSSEKKQLESKSLQALRASYYAAEQQAA